MSLKKYYKQTANVNWLTTPKETIWVETIFPNVEGNYIQPENSALITTPLGVNLDLLDDKDYVFESIKTIDI